MSSANAPFFLIAFAAGNLLGPLTIGRLFDTIGRKQMIAGTYVTSGLMLAVTAYLVEILLGVAAERRPLEDVASPLSLIRKAADTAGTRARPSTA